MSHVITRVDYLFKFERVRRPSQNFVKTISVTINKQKFIIDHNLYKHSFFHRNIFPFIVHTISSVWIKVNRPHRLNNQESEVSNKPTNDIRDAQIQPLLCEGWTDTSRPSFRSANPTSPTYVLRLPRCECIFFLICV